ANQFMVPRTQIAAIDIEAPIEKALQQVATRPYTRLPVYRHYIDNIIGVLHMKDLIECQLQEGGIRSIEPLIRPIPFMPENIMADRLLANLRESRSHQAILQDEFGGVAGLVTLRDVLEEVLGEVGDELQTVQPQPERLADGRVRLPGGMPVADVETWKSTPFQPETATFIGRLIVSRG